MDDPKNLPGSPVNPDEPKQNNQPAHTDTDAEPEPEPTLTQWFARNGLVILLFGALFVYLLSTDGFWGLWNLLKVVLGLGFVIFIHELGHFLVAKWCDVHVTTFSIGFGPAIPGCKYKWGETTYMIGIIPLGGYVQMVGQVDLDETADATEEDPRSYKNKTVWQRMAIISAGVVMNAILAMVLFAIVFLGPGKEVPAAVVSSVDSGSEAFAKGIPTGARIVQIGTVKDPNFEDVLDVVMGTTHDQAVELVYELPGKSPIPTLITPRFNPVDGRPLIGIGPGNRLQFAELRAMRGYGNLKSPALPGTPAADATPAFAFEDIVIATTDPDDPSKVTALPKDPNYFEKGEQRDYFEFARRMDLLRGQDVIIRVQRKSGKETTTVDVKVPPGYHRSVDARMQMGQITALREQSDAAKGLQKRSDAREGDVIEEVTVHDAEGKKIVFADKTLDPVRLPFELEQWADALYRAKPNPTEKERTVTLKIRRQKPMGSSDKDNRDHEKKEVALVWDPQWRFDHVRPSGVNSPLPIPELGLGYQVKSIVVDAGKGSKLQPGDLLKSIRFFGINAEGKQEALLAIDKLEEDQWAYAFSVLQNMQAGSKVELTVQRNGKLETIELVPASDKSWPSADRDLVLALDSRLLKADNVVDAVALGFEDTHRRMMTVYRNLRGLIIGRISINNLAGPVTIARMAYRVADYDFGKFLLLIGMISINLAVINFLPIPVLDGGHMVFLIYEKLRGKPASEAVRVGATYAGLAVILLLMAFVFVLDIRRIIIGS